MVMGEKAGGCSRDGGVGNMRWRSAIAGRKGGREDERLSQEDRDISNERKRY